MPLINDDTQAFGQFNSNNVPPEKPKRFWERRWFKTLSIIVVMILITLGGLFGYQGYQNHELTAKAEAITPKPTSTVKQSTISTSRVDDPKSYVYGNSNSGVPTATQLTKYRNENGIMTKWGYAVAPTQKGLANPIKLLPINEGVSNKVLANGWGTVKNNFKMGEGNNVLAAHNFADNVTFASPLQKIDVSKLPVFYLTDGDKAYKYELNRKLIVNDNSSEYADVIKESNDNLLTLVTCNEPNPWVNLHPKTRIVVQGKLVDVTPLDQLNSATRSLFPNFKA